MSERAQIPAAPAQSQQAAPDAFAHALAWIRAQRPLRNRRLQEIAAELRNGALGNAEKALREFLCRHPDYPDAIMLTAQAALRRGRAREAEKLLVQCLELDPSFIAARFELATVLLRANKAQAALIECEELLKYEPQNPLFRKLKASALGASGEFVVSLEMWRALTLDCPAQPECWSGYGNVLSIVGLQEDSVAAYRKAIALNPAFSEGWLCLADLKIVRFSTGEIEEMENQLGVAGASSEDRTNLHFALGKAYADRGSYEQSFNNFAKGNAIRRLAIKHDPDTLTAFVSRCKQALTADFLCTHGSGCTSSGPIFLVGMPRAGSTLVEQILASHSQIEGTAELVDLYQLAKEIQQTATQQGCTYPAVLARTDSTDLRRLGERYLEGTQSRRKLGRTFFTDKMGSNFVHIGLIHLILPNARIIDVRRHPMACCFSNFAQVFPTGGVENAYRLTDLARYYRNYVELMDHFDSVLPGKVHRIFYETLVECPERTIRHLLDHLGLQFEEACLNFFNTGRAITTISSEQVRRPIYRDSMDYWRHYEPWLGALKTALGSVLDLYPDVPSFD